MGNHLDLILASWICRKKYSCIWKKLSHQSVTTLSIQAILLSGILYWVSFQEEGKICVLIVRSLLGIIGRSLERLRKTIKVMSENPVVIGTITLEWIYCRTIRAFDTAINNCGCWPLQSVALEISTKERVIQRPAFTDFDLKRKASEYVLLSIKWRWEERVTNLWTYLSSIEDLGVRRSLRNAEVSVSKVIAPWVILMWS